ncbi:hypothetical protein H0O02_03135 [Candidatus Micrarchaeota archaeon]|nr:hypothetical protein [Candidatus Micrarchaeota archaeon]
MEPPQNASVYPLKGVSLSPKSFTGNDFAQFFTEAREAGDIVMWAGDWNELEGQGSPKVVAELASTYDYIPLIEVTYYTQGTGQLIRPLDEATKQAYKDSAVAFAEKYKPEYFAMGIETNIMYEKSPEDFEEFVAFYNEVYDAVKAASPNTKVFTVFQLESMKGCTFWQENSCDSSKAEWDIMGRFKSDMAVFTTYPCLVFKDPADIPADYYTEISQHTTKPIAFTEIGWYSEAYPPGWESSDAKQAQYVTRLFELTDGMDVEVMVWSFLYDPGTEAPFDSMGLLNDDGTERPALDAWMNGGE